MIYQPLRPAAVRSDQESNALCFPTFTDVSIKSLTLNSTIVPLLNQEKLPIFCICLLQSDSHPLGHILHTAQLVHQSRAFSILLETVEYQCQAGVFPHFGPSASRLEHRQSKERCGR